MVSWNLLEQNHGRQCIGFILHSLWYIWRTDMPDATLSRYGSPNATKYSA